jgi:hypothetical protein
MDTNTVINIIFIGTIIGIVFIYYYFYSQKNDNQNNIQLEELAKSPYTDIVLDDKIDEKKIEANILMFESDSYKKKYNTLPWDSNNTDCDKQIDYLTHVVNRNSKVIIY